MRSSRGAATAASTSPPRRSPMRIEAGPFALAWRMLRRNWAAGELRVLLLALFIAVASVTTVGFFADRVQSALDHQANELLGGDLVMIADHPIAPAVLESARRERLAIAQTQTFPSMVSAASGVNLAE